MSQHKLNTSSLDEVINTTTRYSIPKEYIIELNGKEYNLSITNIGGHLLKYQLKFYQNEDLIASLDFDVIKYDDKGVESQGKLVKLDISESYETNPLVYFAVLYLGLNLCSSLSYQSLNCRDLSQRPIGTGNIKNLDLLIEMQKLEIGIFCKENNTFYLHSKKR